jgi:hypothetical protein
MQNFQKQNELLEANYFQVEELEERLENKWGGGGSSNSEPLVSCTITQEVNICNGTITPLASVLQRGTCPTPANVYVCK